MEELATQLAAVRTRYPLQRIAVNGDAWEYIDTGHGPATLLLLPGALGIADTSFGYILAFAAAYRVLSLSYPAATADVRMLTSGIAALLASTGAGQAHVVGGSYSGFVAQYLAAWHPASVASLLLSNTGAPSAQRSGSYGFGARMLALLPERAVHAQMQRRIHRFLPAATPVQHFWRSYFAELIPTFRKQTLVNRMRMQAQMDSARLSYSLHAHPWHGPALLLDAGEDVLVSPHDRAALAARMPQARAVTLPDRGHAASLEETSTYISIYREFLCGLPPAAPGSTT